MENGLHVLENSPHHQWEQQNIGMWTFGTARIFLTRSTCPGLDMPRRLQCASFPAPPHTTATRHGHVNIMTPLYFSNKQHLSLQFWFLQPCGFWLNPLPLPPSTPSFPPTPCEPQNLGTKCSWPTCVFLSVLSILVAHTQWAPLPPPTPSHVNTLHGLTCWCVHNISPNIQALAQTQRTITYIIPGSYSKH